MKKLLILIFALMVVFSCQKKEQEIVDPSNNVGEVIFNAIQIDPSSQLKSTDNEWLCPTDESGELLIPGAAKIVIEGFADPFWSEIFYIDDKLYTQSIKLPVNSDTQEEYTVTYFGLYDQIGGTLIMATPTQGSHYSKYTEPNVDFKIYVSKFAKAEVPIDVLCFLPDQYEDFGFDWFQITEIVVREFCFFGDICVTDPSNPDWIESLYYLQANHIQIDMPAIFFVKITDEDGNQVPYSPWGNTGWNGEGAPLCVAYPDNLMVDGEVFTAELFLYGPVEGDRFGYSLYATYIIVDDVIYNTDDPDGIDANTPILPHGGDGIYDFVVGDCVNTPPDISFPPYDPENPPIEGSCETAFAYNQNGDDGKTRYCFLQLEKDDASYEENGPTNETFNRWGWTNELLTTGSYTFDIYAAAGQCDLSKGTLVGTLNVDYQAGGNVVLRYNMNTGFNLLEVHLYVGEERLPQKQQGQNFVYTIAPGQYPWVDENLTMLSTYTHTFTGMPDDGIYVVAHAVVCGKY